MGILILIAIAIAAFCIYIYQSEASTNTLRDLLAAGKWREANGETDRLIELTTHRAMGQPLYSPSSYSRLNFEGYDYTPCHILRTIDRLWVQYSDGHFGFSIQLAILEECKKADSGKKIEMKKFVETDGRAILSLANMTFKPKYEHNFELGFDSWERVELIMAWEKLGWIYRGYDGWGEYSFIPKQFSKDIHIQYSLSSPKGHLPVINNNHQLGYLTYTVRCWDRLKNCGHWVTSSSEAPSGYDVPKGINFYPPPSGYDVPKGINFYPPPGPYDRSL